MIALACGGPPTFCAAAAHRLAEPGRIRPIVLITNWRKGNLASIRPFTQVGDDVKQLGMDEAVYSRVQLIRLTGAPEDAVRFWIRDGLLRDPQERGARKHLRFDRTEVKIAAFLREARNNGMNVSAMRALVAKIRAGVTLFEQQKFNFDEIGHARNVLEGEPFDQQIYREISGRLPRSEMAKRVQIAADTFPFDQYETWVTGYHVANGEAILMAWLDADGEWQTDNGFPQDWDLPAASVVVFDWARICAIDWSQAGRP